MQSDARVRGLMAGNTPFGNSLWGLRDGTAVPITCDTRGDRSTNLLAKAEFLNHAFVALGIVLLQVIKQATTLADQHQQPTARTVILLVRFEVFRQLTNAFAQQRNLDFRASRIGGMRTVMVNEGLFLLSG
jgi:hypothetical protein